MFPFIGTSDHISSSFIQLSPPEIDRWKCLQFSQLSSFKLQLLLAAEP